MGQSTKEATFLVRKQRKRENFWWRREREAEKSINRRKALEEKMEKEEAKKTFLGSVKLNVLV